MTKFHRKQNPNIKFYFFVLHKSRKDMLFTKREQLCTKPSEEHEFWPAISACKFTLLKYFTEPRDPQEVPVIYHTTKNQFNEDVVHMCKKRWHVSDWFLKPNNYIIVPLTALVGTNRLASMVVRCQLRDLIINVNA